jgi:hypothetical protein
VNYKLAFEEVPDIDKFYKYTAGMRHIFAQLFQRFTGKIKEASETVPTVLPITKRWLRPLREPPGDK